MSLYQHGEHGTLISCPDHLAALLGSGWAKASAAKVADQTANPQPASADEPPPKSGKGSSDANWTEYARRQGVVVTDEMSRKEVIDACEAAGIPT